MRKHPDEEEKRISRETIYRIDDRMRLHDQIKPSSWWNSTDGKYEVLAKALDHRPTSDLKKQQDRVKSIRDAKKDIAQDGL